MDNILCLGSFSLGVIGYSLFRPIRFEKNTETAFKNSQAVGKYYDIGSVVLFHVKFFHTF